MNQNQQPTERIRGALLRFLKLESAGGILLVITAVLALLMANSPLAGLYQRLLDIPVTVSVGQLGLSKPLLLWINDGLMAVFFLLVGLEIKREVLEGELSSREQVLLPAIAAVAGLLLPAGIYAFLNRGDPQAMNGWAIPAATDIAFALGVLSLLGSRVNVGLKVFLTAIAIMDDLAAIIIIAVFYSGDLSVTALLLGAGAFVLMVILNLRGVTRTAAYIAVGTVMWACMVKSGVHATLAGVLTAVCIPLRATDEEGHSPARHLEHTLHPWVAYAILPVFAFANAGVSFGGLEPADFVGTVPLGIMLGLFVGKQVGVFLATWATVSLGLARLPRGTNWAQIYGVSALCGIGFTMSLFIGTLAFEHGGFEYAAAVRVGVLGGSLLSAVLGYTVLRLARPAEPAGA